MRNSRKGQRYVSPAVVTGCIAVSLAVIVSFFHGGLSVLVLIFFILFCFVASFFPTWGFFLPVDSRGHTGRPVVALTFDDGPGPSTTRPLLQLLKQHNVQAAFFIVGEKAVEHGDLIAAILEHGHDIGNHSYSHDPFLMLRSAKTLYREIESAQTVLKRFGICPLAFRPPVGITNPRLYSVLSQQGLSCVTFSCRANDFGNRFIQGLSERILTKVKPDDIILLHDVCPKGAMDIEGFIREIDLILCGLKNKELQIVPLEELLEKPVMIGIGSEDRV
ncbi:MAG: polysaccharide deacetylase family protein [Syntrophaceae bacterium]